MDITGLCIAVVQQARIFVTSSKDRITKVQEGQHRYATLTGNLDQILRHLNDVERLRRNFPTSLPTSIAPLFEETLADVRDSFKEDNFNVLPSLEKAFVGSSSAMGKVRQVVRAKTLSDRLNAMQNKTEKVSNQLQHLVSVIASALKIDETQAVVTSKIHENRVAIMKKLDNLRVTEEVYRPVESTPAPDHTMVLDLNSKDEKGTPATPEEQLKHSVLHGDSSEIVTAFASSIKPAYGVLGMAGVGKTVALRGLGHDADVKKRFGDGIHYMTFGRDATLQTAIAEIASIMTLTGASTQVQNVMRAKSLKDAVNTALMWFNGKICLYLLDDLWSSESLPYGFFDDLRQLLRGSPRSRMVISTRSYAIASQAGRVVDFGPRHPLGNVSVDMFMSHAIGQSSTRSLSADLRSSVQKILAICGGLPIALSVTGCAVAKLVRMYGTFEKACDAYAIKLEKKRTLLGDKCPAYGSSLKAAIMVSLEHLEVDFLELLKENSVQIDSSIFDMYTSLCVLPNQVWVPLSVLSRLWKLEEDVAFDIASLFDGMSLAAITARRQSSELSDEKGIVLHDLLLDFCKEKAKETKSFRHWHAQLLDGFLETPPQHAPEGQNTEVVGRIIDFSPRPWWSDTVTEDGYVHVNLSRHLKSAGYGIELAALLLEGRWTQLRRRIGGVLALKTDFEMLENVFEEDIMRIFELIFKTVRLSWGRMMKGLRPFQFQVCGGLEKFRKSSALVETYLRSIEMSTPKPYLLPMSPFAPDVESSPILEIPVERRSLCAACSPCGQYIACGAEGDIVIANTSNGEIIQLMQGHKRFVTCVTFGAGAKEVVSGSVDGKVMLWEWELSKYPVRVFMGHDDRVTGIAINSKTGRVFSSSSDRTLRIWDMTSTAQICKLPQSHAVYCVAECGKGDMMAFGLDDGTLHVIDKDGTQVHSEDTRFFSISCVLFSPNGSHLAAGSFDRTVQIWNTQTWASEYLIGHEGWVTCVSFSPDGKQMASSSFDCTIRLWDVESGECVGISTKIDFVITSVSFTVHKTIVSGSRDGVVRIWDARLGEGSKRYVFGHSGSVWGTAISPNGLQVASASLDKTVRLWNAQTGEQVGIPLQGHKSLVSSVSFSPDGWHLVSGSNDYTLRLWDMRTNTQIGESFEGHQKYVNSVSFSCDGLRIVSGSSEGTVRIWNSETHEQIGAALQGHSSSFHCVSESSDGCHVVGRHRNGIVIIWNLENKSIVWKSEQHATGLENELTNEEAEKIIRSCGQQTPHLWPKSFPEYTAELYCVDESVYSNLLGGKTLLADTLIRRLPFHWWSYCTGRKVFAAGQISGAVAICKLIPE